MGVGHCLFIVSIRAGFLADTAGLRFGDQILEINDIPVDTLSVTEATDILLQESSTRLHIRVQPHVITCTVAPSLKASSMGITLEHGAITRLRKHGPLYSAGLLPGH